MRKNKLKYWVIAFLVLLAFTGKAQDSIPQSKYDSLLTEFNKSSLVVDSLKEVVIVKKHLVDSFHTEVIRANLRFIRVKYYVNIANKSRSKAGYLKGWINGLFDNGAFTFTIKAKADLLEYIPTLKAVESDKYMLGVPDN